MGQSWVDIFEVMYCLTPAKGGGHTCFIDTSEVPCVYEVQKLSNIAMCTKYMAEQSSTFAQDSHIWKVTNTSNVLSFDQ